jgi:beta-galactosidase GanA
LLITPDGVEVSERWQENQTLLFILNHSSLPQAISLPDGYIDLFAGMAREGSVTIAPYDVMILAKQK